MPFLPASGSREVEWKNGGGFTREIAVYPPGAGFDDFEWRVSLARLTEDGVFSQFPSVDRLFAVVGGGGLRLEREGEPPVALRPESPPCAFPGEAAVFAVLMGEPVVALNVMTRRGAASASLDIVDPSASIALPSTAGVWLALALCGFAELETEDGRQLLQTGDAWIGRGGPAPRLSSRAKARIAAMRFE